MTQEQHRDNAVRDRAHQIWEAAGKPDGEHESHWEQAVQELAAESVVEGSSGSAPPEDSAIRKKRAAPKGA